MRRPDATTDSQAAASTIGPASGGGMAANSAPDASEAFAHAEVSIAVPILKRCHTD